jgi:uncharacterized protein (TIGR00269 family)
MVKKCSKCSNPAVTLIRYNGTHLCKDHFIRYFEKRVKKDVKKQGKTYKKTRFGVAISGGKDSTVALKMIHDIFSVRNNVEIIGISVDEGIQGYRDENIKTAKNNCEKLGIEHYVVSFEEMMGYRMDEIASIGKELGDCAYCGVFRRFCLNTTAKKLKVDRLVTGHNLDDISQSILMNFVNGDMQKLARLGPHEKIQPGLIPRFMPLRTIPEKENALYAILNNLEFHDSVCPFSGDAHRKKFQKIINDLEFDHPGTRHSILSSYESIKDLLYEKYPTVELNKCTVCGEPCSEDLCKTCMLKQKIKKR